MNTPLKSMMMAVLAAVTLGAPSMAETPLESLETADANRGWEAVGRLNFGPDGFCTASLITSDVVLTAAHCLYDAATGERIDPSKIEFQPGLRNGRAEAYRGVRRIVVHPEYDFSDSTRLSRVGSDLALLELDQPVRLGHVRPFRTQVRVEAGQVVQVVSYGQDRADAPSHESACEILARDNEILVLSCEVDFGSSGAPIFIRYGDETRIISVVSAKAQWEGQDVSLAAVMEGQLDALIGEFARTPAIGAVGKRLAIDGAVDTSASR
ncbi:trypsin-like serine peptidase [Jannaschia donghaensis]|uniref:V8-like Glu-specific endopeptidase n=1 Tax=Jannaschia donghaensis TaxID=420998 RepID=A0A0M6YF62_9RHOB|nr:trypsin-like serine protease [Jannaschia donghaensis]CTQ48590.1 V8-like Glu-specific endopeptidase [Jannaschia donghaensis]